MFVSKEFCDYYYFYAHLSLDKLIQCYKDSNIDHSIDARFCFDQLTLPYIYIPSLRPDYIAKAPQKGNQEGLSI